MIASEKILRAFTKYCEKHPKQRFWQALRNWSEHKFILVSDIPPREHDWGGTSTRLPVQIDTFYWEKRRS